MIPPRSWGGPYAPRSVRRVPQTLDETDRQLCQLLIADPRTSNRALADALGITDETVAARLRRLRETGVLGTTVAIDWEAAGYGAAADVRLRLDGCSADDVVGDLIDDRVLLAAKATGCCDIYVALLGTDLRDIRATVSERYQRHPGVRDITVNVVTEICRYDLHSLTLPAPVWSPRDLPAPQPELDDLDVRLLELLATDGHASNRETARRLGVSDGTVRARIRRLEEGGLLRIIAGVDPIATGDLRAYAMAFVTVAGNGDATDELLRSPFVQAAHRSLGTADLVVMLAANSQHHLDAYLVDELRGIKGVRTLEVAYVVEVLEHKTYLGRLLA